MIRSFVVQEVECAFKRELQIQSTVMSVRLILTFLKLHVFGRIWADPLPRIPVPAMPRVPGCRTRVQKTPEGHEIKHSLMTEVPLQSSDSEAMEQLLGAVKKDVDLIVRWARAEVSEAGERLATRKALAASGTVNHVGKTNAPSGICQRRSREFADYLSHAAATFESRGFSHLIEGERAWALYPKPLPITTWELGIPTPKLLLAHAALLVAAHPAITSSLLQSLELYDKDGVLFCLVPINGTYYLVGEKRRRGPALAEQRILLTSETIKVVNDIIELTAPLRAHLKRVGDEGWRKLFLCTESLGWTPKPWRPVQAAAESSAWLASRLQQLVGLSETQAEGLAKRFSLSRLRGSAGVLVYLETGSVQRMAEALGHMNWNPSLLDHYLPRPIQVFFVERWIRLFQVGIICETLKDSLLLLRASGFTTMAELDEFLRLHALRRIPLHLEDPEAPRPVDPSPIDQVVFGIEIGVLTLLISLELAVDAALRVAGTRALKWARISRHLVSHLETQQEQPEFSEMVKLARSHADPNKVAAFIHE